MTSNAERAWFCLRTQPKHEHIAAAHLARDGEVEVFLPRIKFQRATRRGKQWFTEALFPSYLFAKFDWEKDLRRLGYAPGVSTVVRFGDRWPTVPEEVMRELQEAVGAESLHVQEEGFSEGEEVEVVEGSLAGIQAIVTRHHPAGRRVQVLLEFLGRQASVEVDAEALVKRTDPRKGVMIGTARKEGTD